MGWLLRYSGRLFALADLITFTHTHMCRHIRTLIALLPPHELSWFLSVDMFVGKVIDDTFAGNLITIQSIAELASNAWCPLHPAINVSLWRSNGSVQCFTCEGGVLVISTETGIKGPCSRFSRDFLYSDLTYTLRNDIRSSVNIGEIEPCKYQFNRDRKKGKLKHHINVYPDLT